MIHKVARNDGEVAFGKHIFSSDTGPTASIVTPGCLNGYSTRHTIVLCPFLHIPRSPKSRTYNAAGIRRQQYRPRWNGYPLGTIWSIRRDSGFRMFPRQGGGSLFFPRLSRL